jgi:hypothetical protein
MIDKSKTYRTRDGREVRIYATDGGGEYPVHGAVLGANFWSATNWSENGCYRINHDDHEYDLIEVRPHHKRTVWLNVYHDEPDILAYPSKEEADGPFHNRIACIKVDLDFEEGEGL